MTLSSFYNRKNYKLINLIYLLTYIPWIIRGKPHLDIGIVNIDMDCNYTMYIQYEYKYGTRVLISP
jgi:hypothetical protein